MDVGVVEAEPFTDATPAAFALPFSPLGSAAAEEEVPAGAGQRAWVLTLGANAGMVKYCGVVPSSRWEARSVAASRRRERPWET